MHPSPPVTEVQVENVTFSPAVKPPGSTKHHFLGGAGERGLEIQGKFIKFTAIGVYLEDDAVSSLAVKWKGKRAEELTDSVEFFRDIVTVKMGKTSSKVSPDERTVVLKIQWNCEGPCEGRKIKLEKISTFKGVENLTLEGARVLVTVEGTMYTEKLVLYLEKELKKKDNKEAAGRGENKEGRGGEKNKKAKETAPKVDPPAKRDGGGGGEKKDNKEAAGRGENKEARCGEKNKKAKKTAPKVDPPAKKDGGGGGEKKDNKEAAGRGENKEASGGEKNKKAKETAPKVDPPAKKDGGGGGEKKDNKEAAERGENKEASGGEKNKKAKETAPAPVDKGGEKDKAIAAGGSRDGAKDENYGCLNPQPKNRSEKKMDNKKPPKESTVVLKIRLLCQGCGGCIDKIKEEISKLEKKISTIKGFENLTVDGGSVLVTVKGTMDGTMDANELALELEKKLKKKTEVVPPTKKVDGGGEKKDNKEAAVGGENKEAGGEKNKKAKETAPAPVNKGGEKDKAIAAGSGRDCAKYENYRSSQEQQAQPRPQDAASQSWYPQFLVSPNSSRSSTPGSSYSLQRPTEYPQTGSHVSPGEAAGVIALLKDKSVDELWKLLSDKDAYHRFLLSVDPVKIQNNIRDVLRKENLQLAELAAAEKKLNELNRQKEELLKFYSSGSLLQKLQEAMNKTEEESEALHRQLLDKEIDIVSFVQKYKKLRTIYHQRELVFPWLSHEKPHN